MLYVLYKAKTQKITNLLNDSSNKEFKFATKNWCVIDRQTTGDYNEHTPIKSDTETIKQSLCN